MVTTHAIFFAPERHTHQSLADLLYGVIINYLQCRTKADHVRDKLALT